MTTRGKANRGFYGRALTAKQLLVEGAVVAPTAARTLYAALDDLMDRVEDPISVAAASRYTYIGALQPGVERQVSPVLQTRNLDL